MEIATLQQYAKHKNGTYAAIVMNDESKQLLDNFVHMSLDPEGLPIKSDTYHCTVMFSRAPVPDAERLKREIEAVAFVTGYEVFPTKDGTKCLVARLQCDLAEKLSHELTKMGATSDYPTYKAHVTLCELYTGSEAVETFPKPQFPLHFHKLIVEPLIE